MRAASELPSQLHGGRQVEPVVGRAEQRCRGGPEEDGAGLHAAGQEQPAGQQDAGEDGQAAHPRGGRVVEIAVAGRGHRPDPLGEPGGNRSEHERRRSCDEERPEGVELVHRSVSLTGG